MVNIWQVFWRFLALGCVSFGGPAAHIGYFQKAFVDKLKWIDEKSYAGLISLSQFLPGPGSSQIGFAIGWRRAGIMGGVAAFIGFTLPSFLLMYFVAISSADLAQSPVYLAVVHGLKLLAVVVVADATLSMYKSFCQEKASIAIAVFSAIILLLLPSIWSQMGVLIVAALVGILFKNIVGTQMVLNHQKIKKIPLLLFLILLLVLPFVAGYFQPLDVFSDFYQTGSLVFGGGHVVLPLLQQTIGEAVTTDRFLTGYAAAQAIPGPMFTIAAFLGADLSSTDQMLFALIATLGIFVPGFLLVLSFIGSWQSFASRPKVAGAVWGINAAVVGLLLTALYNPIFISAVIQPIDMVLVLLGFWTLRCLNVAIVLLVLFYALTGVLLNT